MRPQQVAKRHKPEHELARRLTEAGNAINAGRFDEGEAICNKLLASYPNRPEIYNLLGFVEVGRKRYAVAAHYFSKAVEISPNNIGFLNNMGRAYLDFDRPELALPPLIRATTLDPKQVEAFTTIARFYKTVDKPELALPYLEKAVSSAPHNNHVRMEYADCLRGAGQFEKAQAEFNILEKDNAHRVMTLVHLARMSSGKDNQELLAKIETEIESPEIRDGGKSLLHYSAGKLLEDLQDFDRSFRHYETANGLNDASFDVKSHAAQHEALKGLFVRELFASRREHGNPSEVPVFVVGMPRSGTTLTEQIIASHPLAAGAGEQSRIRKMAASLGFRRDFGSFAAEVRKMGSREISILSRNYLGLLRLFSAKAERIVDKMPHNFEMLGFIAVLFPNARVIHCRRNPIDNCVSCYTNSFSKFHSYSNDLRTLGSYYRDYDRLMQHWREHLPLRMFELDYQRLTQDPETETRKLIDFLGLPWDDRCLAFNKRKTVVSTLSQWQVRQPMYTSSVQRWKRFEKHLGPLIDALGDLAVVN